MKRWARRSKVLIIAFKIWDNWLLRRRFASGVIIETNHGSTLGRKNLDESVSYIDEQFNDYLTYGQLTNQQLCGKRILELGFGDNVGVALRFLAAGASRVVCVDKFYSKRDVAKERDIYVALRNKLDGEQKRFDAAVDIAHGIKFNSSKLSCINGLDLDMGAGKLLEQEEMFDIIISRAVIEEIYEPERVFAAVDRLLVPGGLMLHKIDLSDYGIFSQGGMHPLTFLTIPQSIYRLMASDSGIPNRKLIGYYRKKMRDLGYDSIFLITSIVGLGPVVPHRELVELDSDHYRLAIPVINEIRSKLCPEYRDLPNDELMVGGVFLVARKPALP